MIDIDKQIAAVRREVGMRKHVYPRWVQAGKMTAESAEHEIAAMQAAQATLEAVRDDLQAKKEPGLF